MTTTIDQSFNEAMDSLRQINNELFYKELKENMDETITKLEKNYSNTSNKLKSMDSSVGKLVVDFEESFKDMRSDFVDSSQSMLESVSNELVSLFAEQREDTNQVLDNFVELQKRFLAVHQDLDILRKDQDKRFTEFLERQQSAFEGATTRLKEQFDTFIEKQDSATSQRAQELNEMYEHFMRRLEADYKEHILKLTEANKRHNQFVVDKLTTYQKVFETNLSNSRESIKRQYEQMYTQLGDVESKLQTIQIEQKNQFNQLIEKLSNKDNKDKQAHKRLLGIGIGIVVVQLVLVVLQFV